MRRMGSLSFFAQLSFCVTSTYCHTTANNAKHEGVALWSCLDQCSGSMTFWCGSGSVSGSADPCFWLMDSDPDADPDPDIFVIDLQEAKKTNFILKVFLIITFWRYIYIIFQRQKFQKKSQNNRNQGFSYYFCLMIEGSGSGSGSIPLTSGS